MQDYKNRRILEGQEAPNILRTLGNPVNLQILILLTGGGMNTRELARILRRDESDVSRRLKRLRELGLVRSQWARVGGRNVKMYTLASDRLNIQIDRNGLRIVDGTVSGIDLNEWTGRAWRPPKPPRLFVGREKELRRLDEAIKSAPVIVVTGLPGIGKTSLVSNWIERNHPKQVFWHLGTYVDHVDAIIKRISLFLTAHGRVKLRDYLVRWPEHVEEAFPIAVEELSRLGALLVVDDTHKIIDPRALEFIGYLAEHAGDYKLVLISRQPPRLLNRLGNVESINLEGLRKEDAQRLIEKLVEKPLPLETLEKVHATLGGHPFLIKWAATLARSHGLEILDYIVKRQVPSRLFLEELNQFLNDHEQSVLRILTCMGGRMARYWEDVLLRQQRYRRALQTLADKNIVTETPFQYIVKDLVYNQFSGTLNSEDCRPVAENLTHRLTRYGDIEKYLDVFETVARWGYEDLLLKLVRYRLSHIRSRILDYLALYDKLLDLAIENVRDPYARAALFSEKSVVHINLTSDRETALWYLNRAIPPLEEANEHLILSITYSRLLYLLGRDIESLERKALNHARLISDEKARHAALTHLHANLAYYYALKGDFAKTLWHTEEEVKHAEFLSGEDEYWHSVFQKEIVRYIVEKQVDMKAITEARRRLEKLGWVKLPLIIATYEALLQLALGHPRKAVNTASRALSRIVGVEPLKSTLTYACNLSAILSISLQKTQGQRDLELNLSEALKQIMEECRKGGHSACFYWLWVKYFNFGDHWSGEDLEKEITRTCETYDIDLFKEAMATK